MPVSECHIVPSVLSSATCTTNTTDTPLGNDTVSATDATCTTASAVTIRINNITYELSAVAPERFISSPIKAVRHA